MLSHYLHLSVGLFSILHYAEIHTLDISAQCLIAIAQKTLYFKSCAIYLLSALSQWASSLLSPCFNQGSSADDDPLDHPRPNFLWRQYQCMKCVTFYSTEAFTSSLLWCNRNLREKEEKFWGSNQCPEDICSSNITCWTVRDYFLRYPAPGKEQPLTAVQADWGAEKDLEVLVGKKLNAIKITAYWAVLAGNTASRLRGKDYLSST